MADDFTGVPADQWWRATRDATAARLIAVVALLLTALLTLALIQRGVLAGWSDLFRIAHAHE